MAVSAIIDISKRGAIEKWLKSKPNDISQAIAARIALRLLPMAHRAAALEASHKFDFSTFLLSVFRANAVAWASRKYPFIDMSAAAKTANASVYKYVSNSRTASVASIAASAAGSRAADSRVAAIVSIAVAYVTEVATSRTATALLTDISNDIDSVIKHKSTAAELITKPLWMRGMPEHIEIA